jgi:hypothetical protein
VQPVVHPDPGLLPPPQGVRAAVGGRNGRGGAPGRLGLRRAGRDTRAPAPGSQSPLHIPPKVFILRATDDSPLFNNKDIGRERGEGGDGAELGSGGEGAPLRRQEAAPGARRPRVPRERRAPRRPAHAPSTWPLPPRQAEPRVHIQAAGPAGRQGCGRGRAAGRRSASVPRRPGGPQLRPQPERKRRDRAAPSCLPSPHTPTTATPPAAGNGLWLDPQKQACLVLWRRVEEWAEVILSWASTYGVSDAVMLLEDLSSGDDVRNTGEGDRGQGWAAQGGEDMGEEGHSQQRGPRGRGLVQTGPRARCPRPLPFPPPELQGLHREVLLRALKVLEAQGKVRCALRATRGKAGGPGRALLVAPQRARTGSWHRASQQTLDRTLLPPTPPPPVCLPPPPGPQVVSRGHARGGGRQVSVTPRRPARAAPPLPARAGGACCL